MVRSLLLLPVLLVTACAPSLPPAEKTPSFPPPEKTIEGLYAPYVSHAAEHGDFGWEKANVYSKRFKGVIDRGFDYSALLNEPVIDYDPIVNAQDYSISNLHIVVDRAPDNGKAHVIAQFENLDQKTEVGYDMMFENGGWKIDAIRAGDQDFSKTIDDALKPIGDPRAMQAPVERIYARYSGSPQTEPLFRWASLTDGLRDKLKRAQAKAVLSGFDPVCGGNCGPISGVKLEAVSGGVISRFRVGNDDRVVTYDVIEAGGNWLIDDIHAAGNRGWDLIQKLEDAGIH